ncbi:MAG TPA: RNase adapter RapZ, partial [Kofleriaceae bacterium]|nr:RNase adapter RapZ [Kofleriaceae bacterium]
MQIVIVTGLSGAGKSTALRALEDIEFTCVDNIPVPLVTQMVDHLAHEGDRDKLAIAIDARQRRALTAWQQTITKLRSSGHRLEVMFLDASDQVLLRRFSETRRRHPLSGDDVLDGIRRDRELMAEMRQGAAIVDTSQLNTHQLKAIIQDRYGGTGKLAVTIVSFGFKHGLPLEFNLVFDVRFLPNPYFEPSLTHLDGRDPDVAKFVLGPEGS